VSDLLVDHHGALLVGRSAHEAGVAALYLAAVQLLRDRPEEALRWIQRSRVFRGRAPEVRAIAVPHCGQVFSVDDHLAGGWLKHTAYDVQKG
jgi:hypothetical protein